MPTGRHSSSTSTPGDAAAKACGILDRARHAPRQSRRRAPPCAPPRSQTSATPCPRRLQRGIEVGVRARLCAAIWEVLLPRSLSGRSSNFSTREWGATACVCGLATAGRIAGQQQPRFQGVDSMRTQPARRRPSPPMWPPASEKASMGSANLVVLRITKSCGMPEPTPAVLKRRWGKEGREHGLGC